MVKLKDRSNMKQYAQDKPIKWGFNFWYRYASKTGYLYQLDLHLGKRSSEENLLPGVVLKTTESFQSCHCMFFFYHFFNISSLTVKLYEKDLYGIGNSQKDRNEMPEILVDRKIKRGGFEYLYFNE